MASSIAIWQRPRGRGAELRGRLVSTGGVIERWLEAERDQLFLWIPVALGFGIAAWFVLPLRSHWISFILAMVGLVVAGLLLPIGARARRCLMLFAALASIGCGLVWWRANHVGVVPIQRPQVVEFAARIERVERLPAREMMRLTLSPLPGSALPSRIRVNADDGQDAAWMLPGARIRLRARLMPPPPPMLPHGYDFARVAWFQGLGATGKVLGPISLVAPATRGSIAERFATWRSQLTAHILASGEGSAAGIAAALVTGDVGGIEESDQEAMRQSGLSHLLSISGLHVSVVVGGTMWLAMRLLALSPTLALRWPLPVVAAGAGALAGIAYTLLSGGAVPTLRSCIAALLVLIALAMGREGVTLRLVATAATLLLLWQPEALIGPSFQLSFAAVTALVALHEHQGARALFQPRGERWSVTMLRRAGALLATGVIVEIALMPIALYHFQRTGVYGALANMVAIPLTSFVIMPFEALALFADCFGIGKPFWWLANQSLELLLLLARVIAASPGSVMPVPSMPFAALSLMVFGGIWMALWRTWGRWLGLGPLGVGMMLTMMTPAPDLLISGDGKHVAVRDGDRLALLRSGAKAYTRKTFNESAGALLEARAMDDVTAARCSADLCFVDVGEGERRRRILATRTPYFVPRPQFAKACEQADIVVSDRRLPSWCIPRWIKADRVWLERTGGVAMSLTAGRILTVHQPRDDHPWRKAIVRSQPRLPE